MRWIKREVGVSEEAKERFGYWERFFYDRFLWPLLYII